MIAQGASPGFVGDEDASPEGAADGTSTDVRSAAPSGLDDPLLTKPRACALGYHLPPRRGSCKTAFVRHAPTRPASTPTCPIPASRPTSAGPSDTPPPSPGSPASPPGRPCRR